MERYVCNKTVNPVYYTKSMQYRTPTVQLNCSCYYRGNISIEDAMQLRMTKLRLPR